MIHRSCTIKIVGLSSEPHISLYPWSWLQRNSYDPPIKINEPSHEYRTLSPSPYHLTHETDRKVLWGAKIEQSPPSVTYGEAMAEDDKGLFKWLSNIVSSALDMPDQCTN